MKNFNIAVIPGDGIGTEIMPEGIKVLEAIGSKFGIDFNWRTFDWSFDFFQRTGQIMPADGIELLSNFDAIYLGAVGHPGMPDHESLWGLLIPIRRSFDQYINLRPVRLFEGMSCPLANKVAGDIDFYVVRENVEGEYSAIGGVQYEGMENEMVSQVNIFTKKGIDRAMRYAFELANSRSKKHLTSATKSNGIFHAMPYWDKRFKLMAENYPDVTTDQFHIDILTANFVLKPEFFDVVVASNLFGDILSDLGPACTGTIAIAPSANINPEKKFPSMFEPVHGSAPDIMGKGIANPIGMIWAGALMLDHLGLHLEHNFIIHAIEELIREGEVLTKDMGGTATTIEVGNALVKKINEFNFI